MKHRLPIAILLAAASVQAAWLDSPILRAGDNVDIYFTAKARLSYDSNLFYGSANGLPNQGTSWLLAPGFTADFFKEANFSGSVNWRHDYVRYFDSALKGLDADHDVSGATFTYDGGGPLTVQLEASYQEDARNTVEQAALQPANGTLLGQTIYAQTATFGYRLTDKINLSLSASHNSNRYAPLPKPGTSPVVYNTQGLTESDGWTFPLNLRYQVTTRLNLGLAYEHGHTNIYQARGSTAPVPYTGFTKDFYGLTLSGQPTDSGKLDVVLKAGALHSSYDGGADATTSPSYSIALTHTLTERFNHSLNLGDNTSIAVNGRRNESRTANYTLNYVMNEAFRASAYAGISLSGVDTATPATTDIRTGSYGLNATFSPDSHWTYSASYSLTQSYAPSTYNVHQFSLEANLRW